MSKPKNASDLDAILASKYSHPEEIVPVTNRNPYSSYNEKEGNYEFVSSNTYSTFSSEPVKKITRPVCPDCDTPAIFECSCNLKDMECKNGHIWYIDVKGKVIKGDPHDD